MTYSSSTIFWVLVGAAATLFGCGGATSADDGSAGTLNNGGSSTKGGATGTGGSVANGGATSTGGSVANGGATSTGGSVANGGATGTGGSVANGGATSTGGSVANGGAVCCNAIAVCNGGDRTIASQQDCPPGAACYSRSLCCSTVWCASVALCDAIPTCNAGDTLMSGACPPNDACYDVSLCGSTITCRKSTACNPAIEYNRNYVATSPASCQLIKFSCPVNTSMFSNSCGCGCEQAASCPEYVNCMPGSQSDPLALCADATQCPYAERAM